MRYVVDTHTLIWYFRFDSRLGPQARAAIKDPSHQLVIPTLVLAECQHINRRKNLGLVFETVWQTLTTMPRCTLVPLDVFILAHLSPALDIHDSVIVATALHSREFFGEPVALLTNDQAIIQSGLIPTLW